MATTPKTSKSVVKKASKSVSSKPTTSKTKTLGLTIPVFDIDGKALPAVSVNPALFDQKVSPTLMATYVRVYLANQRQGTVATKTRGQVAGTTHKVWRQKGTGRARHGARKASLFRGGGVTFGPSPRDHTLKFNKKQKKLAFFGALSAAHKESRISALSDTKAFEPKTTKFAKFLRSRGLEGKKVLFIAPSIKGNNFALASRNIGNVVVSDIESLNAYALLRGGHIILATSALPKLDTQFLKSNEN